MHTKARLPLDSLISPFIQTIWLGRYGKVTHNFTLKLSWGASFSCKSYVLTYNMKATIGYQTLAIPPGWQISFPGHKSHFLGHHGDNTHCIVLPGINVQINVYSINEHIPVSLYTRTMKLLILIQDVFIHIFNGFIFMETNEAIDNGILIIG